MKKINAEWHEHNVMPRNVTMEQRIKWHLEHSKKCGYRPIPAGVEPEIRKRKVS